LTSGKERKKERESIFVVGENVCRKEEGGTTGISSMRAPKNTTTHNKAKVRGEGWSNKRRIRERKKRKKEKKERN